MSISVQNRLQSDYPVVVLTRPAPRALPSVPAEERIVLGLDEARQIKEWLDAHLSAIEDEAAARHRVGLEERRTAVAAELAAIDRQLGRPPEPAAVGPAESEVLRRKRTPGGCCDRNADNMGCLCLTEARRQDALDGGRPGMPRGPRPGDPPARGRQEYDTRHDDGCSVRRDPECADPGGKH